MRKVSRSGSTSDPSVPAPNEKVQQLTPQQKIGSEKNTHTHTTHTVVPRKKRTRNA